MTTRNKIIVIGGGLAGSEAAWQLACAIEKHDLDYEVNLYEMRPQRKTPAHHTDRLAELVCSNSLGSEFLTTARGLLIKEMQHFDSLIIAEAINAKVPAGQALAVDRDVFGENVTSKIANHPKINLIREELKEIPRDSHVLVATGPLTSELLAEDIQNLLQESLVKQDIGSQDSETAFLNFFDAASPILTVDSIDFGIAYKASRYGKTTTDQTEGDYINCPFYNQEDFDNFYEALMGGEKAPQKDFEKGKYFEGCLPIEVIASRGKQTLTFGPLKPVGLIDPKFLDEEDQLKPDSPRAVAVVQLRQDNVVGSLYNMVGFQTNLKWGEQQRIFSMIPGLENAEIIRYGVMHQNIYLNSPKFLDATMRLRGFPNIFFAGQITGVEGYTESAATGIIAARNIISSLQGDSEWVLPKETMLGALSNYIASADPNNFQPMNSNWGIVNTNPNDMDKKTRKNKKLKNEFLASRSLDLINAC